VVTQDFKEFLWEYDFDHLILCGAPHNPKKMCEVRFQRDENIVIGTLQRGWETFSIQNGFKPGDIIRFKFLAIIFMFLK
jgi:hypothetical protein